MVRFFSALLLAAALTLGAVFPPEAPEATPVFFGMLFPQLLPSPEETPWFLFGEAWAL